MTPTQLYISAVAWTFIHSIWQGAIVFILCACGRRIGLTSQIRGYVGQVSLVTFLISQIITFLLVLQSSAAPVTDAFAWNASGASISLTNQGEIAPVRIPSIFYLARAIAHIQTVLPFVAVVWMAVLFALCARAAVAMVMVRQILARSRDVTAAVNGHVGSLVNEVGITRQVTFLRCDHLAVPATTGWLRPIVLLPYDFDLESNPSHVRAIILHELAHVRRADWLTQCSRSLVGVVYFFHPLVRAILRFSDYDAEEAADELAARALGDRPAYASALLALCERGHAGTSLLLGAAGGSLRHRIVAVLRARTDRPAGLWPSLLGAVASAALALSLVGQLVNGYASEARSASLFEKRSLAETAIETLARGNEFRLGSHALIAAERNDWWHDSACDRSYAGIDNARVQQLLMDAARSGAANASSMPPDALIESVLESGSARDAFLMACLEYPVDEGAAVDMFLRNPRLFEGLKLDEVDAFRLRVSCELNRQRVGRSPLLSDRFNWYRRLYSGDGLFVSSLAAQVASVR
jgi:beta-lactamase regulating signal transducer with metallopeptidase domain